ncbi:hypothetical protein V8E54_002578 [Elaphomyces granulatus]
MLDYGKDRIFNEFRKSDSHSHTVTEPISSKGLDIVTNGHLLNRLENDGSIPLIRSGETLTTFTIVRTPSTYPYQAWNS